MTKPATCRMCGTKYHKTLPMQRVCSPLCALEHARQVNDKKQAKKAAQERKETREKLDAMKRRPELVKVAQQAFNAWVRARDFDKPCISCGKPATDESNGWDAGHYRSVGSAPHLRFVAENVHKQCKRCNQHLAGNHVAYRAGLIERIGLNAVERLERDQTERKYTREGLIELAKQHRAMTRLLRVNT